MREISISIPVYNRVEMLFESFDKVKDVDEVSEVVIVDDASDIEIYEQVKERAAKNSKIKLFRNESNLDCYFNKHEAISHATNDWCILLDSDNQIDFNYVLKLFQIMDWQEDTAYLPSFAAPHFNYTQFEGLTITKENVADYMDNSTFTTALNTHNHFVNKKFYMKCWDRHTNPHTSDSIYMNYLWLKNGGKLYVVPGQTYQHRVDNHYSEQPGHYQTNCHKTGNFHREVEQMLKDLR